MPIEKNFLTPFFSFQILLFRVVPRLVVLLEPDVSIETNWACQCLDVCHLHRPISNFQFNLKKKIFFVYSPEYFILKIKQK